MITNVAEFGSINKISHLLNRGLENLVRTKKRLIPNVQLESLPFYTAAKRRLFTMLRQKEVTVHDFKLRLDPLDSLELSIFQRYEPFETALLTQEIHPGQTVIDVGANIGYYTLLFSKLTGDEGRVFAFEPEPLNYEILSENLARNSRTNVIAFKQAASDVAGKSFLYLSPENYGDHQAYGSGENRKRISVQMSRIDDLVSGPVDLVKLDIQGFEFHALKGMERILKENACLTIFTEFWPEGLRRAGSNASEFLRFLRSSGFEIFYINEYADQLEFAEDRHLLERYSPAIGSHTNLLCRRRIDNR
jgi:FkbM family methyltransferase